MCVHETQRHCATTTAMVRHGSQKSPDGSSWFTKRANIGFREEIWFMAQAVFRWCGSADNWYGLEVHVDLENERHGREFPSLFHCVCVVVE